MKVVPGRVNARRQAERVCLTLSFSATNQNLNQDANDLEVEKQQATN
jgi:hypothetical protein